MASFLKALSLATLLLSSAHASPHALGVNRRQVEDDNNVSDPSGSVFRLSQTEDKLFIVAFEEGKKYVSMLSYIVLFCFT